MALKYLQLKKEIQGMRNLEETLKVLEKIAAIRIHDFRVLNERLGYFENLLKSIFFQALQDKPFSYKFLDSPRGVKENLLLVISSNKGLCGDYNTKIFEKFIKVRKDFSFLGILGEKGKDLVKSFKIKYQLYFPGISDEASFEEASSIYDRLVTFWDENRFLEIKLLYQSFETLAVHIPKVVTIFPVRKHLEEIFKSKKEEGFGEEGLPIFEPSRKRILEYIVTQYLRNFFYRYILEAKLSEISARTLVTDRAQEKANEIVRDLRHKFFVTRKITITQKVQEISVSKYFKKP